MIMYEIILNLISFGIYWISDGYMWNENKGADTHMIRLYVRKSHDKSLKLMVVMTVMTMALLKNHNKIISIIYTIHDTVAI